MTAWGCLTVQERMRIRKIQTFNVVDRTIRLGWLLLWLPGMCLIVALTAVLAYDILFIALPWWFTIPVIGLVIGATFRRRAARAERARQSRGALDEIHRATYGRDPRPWSRRSNR